MAGSVNKCIIIGNCCADPEQRSFANGGSVVNLRVATNESWRDKQTGERKEKVEFHSIAIFNEQLGKIAMQFLKKGAKVYVEGQLQTRKWQDNAGNDRYTTEIVLQNYNGQLTMLDGKSDGAAPSEPRQASPQKQANNGGRANKDEPGSFDHELNDEIPF
jgi:single-strand DNA-binding protein